MSHQVQERYIILKAPLRAKEAPVFDLDQAIQPVGAVQVPMPDKNTP